MLLRTWEGWLQQRGKWDFVGKRLKPTGREWHHILKNGTPFHVSLGTMESLDSQHLIPASSTPLFYPSHTKGILSIIHTKGQVCFLSGNEHVLFFLKPSQMLAPHKVSSAETSCALLLQPAVCVPETSAKPAQMIYCSWGSARQGRGALPSD